jgi:hypothetical protein
MIGLASFFSCAAQTSALSAKSQTSFVLEDQLFVVEASRLVSGEEMCLRGPR